LQEYREKRVDVDRIRTRCFEAGTGRPVVLLHGGTRGDASGGANEEDFHRNFARKFRLISVDRLAFGQQIARLHGRSIGYCRR
jgi:pimeloyl-ACP methyl ester carboxylesterase